MKKKKKEPNQSKEKKNWPFLLRKKKEEKETATADEQKTAPYRIMCTREQFKVLQPVEFAKLKERDDQCLMRISTNIYFPDDQQTSTEADNSLLLNAIFTRTLNPPSKQKADLIACTALRITTAREQRKKIFWTISRSLSPEAERWVYTHFMGLAAGSANQQLLQLQELLRVAIWKDILIIGKTKSLNEEYKNFLPSEATEEGVWFKLHSLCLKTCTLQENEEESSAEQALVNSLQGNSGSDSTRNTNWRSIEIDFFSLRQNLIKKLLEIRTTTGRLPRSLFAALLRVSDCLTIISECEKKSDWWRRISEIATNEQAQPGAYFRVLRNQKKMHAECAIVEQLLNEPQTAKGACHQQLELLSAEISPQEVKNNLQELQSALAEKLIAISKPSCIDCESMFEGCVKYYTRDLQSSQQSSCLANFQQSALKKNASGLVFQLEAKNIPSLSTTEHSVNNHMMREIPEQLRSEQGRALGEILDLPAEKKKCMNEMELTNQNLIIEANWSYPNYLPARV